MACVVVLSRDAVVGNDGVAVGVLRLCSSAVSSSADSTLCVLASPTGDTTLSQGIRRVKKWWHSGEGRR